MAARFSCEKRGTELRKSSLPNELLLADCARQKSLAKRTEGHEADAEFFENRHYLLSRFPPPQRIFALKGRDLLHGMRSANVLHARFREAEMQDLSFGDQFLDRAGNVFHRHIRVDTVLIEQVDAVGPEAFERAFHRRADALRRAVHSAAARNVEAEFRGDNDTVADGLQSLADNFLVLVGP